MVRLAAVLTFAALFAFVSPAFASSVTTPSVDNTTPSAAAGARTVYKITFSVSATGALPLNSGAKVMVTLPSDTGTAAASSGVLHDTTRNADVGSCSAPNASFVATCGLYSGQFVNNSDQLVVSLPGLANPTATTPHTLSVSTTVDTTAAVSNSYSSTTAGQITQPSVKIDAPSSAAFARTNYVVTFTTSSGGGMSNAAGSRLAFTLPGDVDLSAYRNGTLHDVTQNKDVGTCDESTCGFYSGSASPGGDQLQLILYGITNGPAGAGKTITVSTTSDLTPRASTGFTVDAQKVLGTPSVSISAPFSNSSGARTRYVVDVTLSSLGGMSNTAGSELTVKLPAGTDTSAYNGGVVHDVTTGKDTGTCDEPDTNLVSTCGFYSGSSAAGGDHLQLILRGLINGPAGTGKTVSMTTTSDSPSLPSPGFEIVTGHAVSAPTVTIDAPFSKASGARTRWLVAFQLSSTGGMANESASGLTIKLPAGTGTDAWNGGVVHDVTTGKDTGTCDEPDANLVSTCGFYSGSTANAGDQMQLILRGLTNGPASDGNTVAVSTTSDLPTVTSNAFKLVAGDQISKPSVSISGFASPASGARTRYVAAFRLSPTGAMSNEAASQINATLPSGTDAGALSGGVMHDVTRNVDLGTCAASGTAVHCGFYSGSYANGGDLVQMILRGVINGPVGDDKTISISTTSDLPTTTSDAFTLTARQALSTVSTHTAGVNPSAIVRFTTSTSGGLANEIGSQVTLTFPAGTTFPSYSAATMYDLDRAATVGSCSQANVTVTCGFFSGSYSSPGDRLQITFPTLVNYPAGTTLSVSTTSDDAASGPFIPGNTVYPDTTIGTSAPYTLTSTDTPSTFECRIDSGAWFPCSSPYAPSTSVAGTHTLFARAVDSDGNIDQTAASRNFTGTQTLDTTITTGPSGTTSDNTPTFTFTGNGVGFQCKLDSGNYTACDSPYTAGWTDGAHTFAVRSVDAAGVTDGSPATQNFTVDTQQAPAPTVDPPTGTDTATPTFTFSGSGVSFECNLDNRGFAPCTSPYTAPALANGTHTLSVRSRDAGGTPSAPTARAFTVSVPVVVQPTPTATATAIPTTQPTPTPTATAKPTPTPTPTPTAGKTVAVLPSGVVLVKLKGTNTFVPLKDGEAIPYGSQVDATKGKVTITAIPKAGAPPQSADFYDGIFTVSVAKGGVTNLTLSGPLAACSKKKRAHAAAKKPKKRRLWGSGKGNFRTTGKYSAATIRGTTWLVQDSCAGTLTKVKQGVVSVKDFAAHKTVTVKAHRSYTAKPKKR